MSVPETRTSALPAWNRTFLVVFGKREILEGNGHRRLETVADHLLERAPIAVPGARSHRQPLPSGQGACRSGAERPAPRLGDDLAVARHHDTVLDHDGGGR